LQSFFLEEVLQESYNYSSNGANPPSETKMSKRITWTFEPDEDVRSLVSKAMNQLAGRKGDKRGMRTKIICEAVRQHLTNLRGKREVNAG
jgi:hypothetical protein